MWSLQNELDINDPGNHGENQYRVTRMHEERENGMLPAFFWRFFFIGIVHNHSARQPFGVLDFVNQQGKN
ncbi:MAG: hypothetical protein O3A78_05605, partial [Nitrospinae bacterium]|nr:hypothetical protein [Nitrospinota bacterium]